jgi:uncharacterized protein (TIGR02001 family)
MKIMAKALALASLLSASMFATTTAVAEVSYNVGYVSEYYYRGIMQKNSSASAGVDFEQDGMYVGAWTADVGEGLEYDLYAGYGMDVGEVSLGIGFTGYYYTDDWDETYQEVNLSAGYGPVSIGYSIGEWDGDGGQDYDFLEIGIDLGAGFYGTYGSFGDQFDGDYVEIGYGTTISEIDLGVAIIFPSEELQGDEDSDADDEAIVFSIGKSF